MADRRQTDEFIHYYRPYQSDEESGADDDSYTSESWYSQGLDQEPPPEGVNDEGIPNFRAFASQVQLRDAAGPNFSTFREQLEFEVGRLSKNVHYYPYDEPAPDLSGEDTYGRTRFATADGNVTSIVMIDSKYRDRQAYPQPTLFTLRLPRVYKNVVNITLTDLKLLTSFYFFRLNKGNTDITLYEKDRMTLTYEGTLQSTIVKRYITEGSYNIDTLQQELNIKLNYTPLFFDFVNGYSDFVNIFSATGDYAANFNQPGDYFFNNTTNQWIPNPTMNTIVSYFWGNRYAGLTTYSQNQILLAYYYPVINEYLFDEDYAGESLNLEPGIGIDPTITTTEDVRNYILYDFKGIIPIADPIVIAVVNANKPALDKYRLQHTFRYWLVNKYVVSRDTRSQNVFITSPSLNTSLVNLLNQQNAFYLNKTLTALNITTKQYLQLTSNIDRTLAVLQSMYNYEQTSFLNYFAVPWTQYTLDYYANLDYTLLLRNGVNATGIPSNYAQAIDAGIVPLQTDILRSQNTNPPSFWPNLSNTNANTIYLENLSSPTSSFHFVYDMVSSNINLRQPVIQEPENYIYSEYLTKTANVVCPIQSAKYTIFKFRSPVRQTMQVETLPRPLAYRLPTYNRCNYDATINSYFDLSYVYFFTSNTPYSPNNPLYEMAYDNLPQEHLKTIPGWDSSNTDSYARNFSSSISQYASSFVLDVLQYNRSLYTTFITPQVSSATVSQFSSFTYSLNLSVQFCSSILNLSTLTTPNTAYTLFVYHDRGAFQADVLCNRNENPKFYKYSKSFGPNDSNGEIQFTSYPNQQYFMCLRPNSTNFGTTYPCIVPYFASNFTLTQQSLSVEGLNPATDLFSPQFQQLVRTNFNYAQIYDSNWIRLPIQSNLWAPDPTGNPINQEIDIATIPIGYDGNGVSTDYTDYIPYIFNSPAYSFYPATNLAIDPINKYQFQCNSPYNTTTQTYLYADGSSAIFTPGLANTYTPGIVDARQYKIAHYYSVNYLPESDETFGLPQGLIGSQDEAQKPFTISTTLGVEIPGYSYGGGAASTLQLSQGVLGFNFIPTEGVWNLKEVVFRSAIEDSNNDPNKTIKYLGVFNMGSILSTSTKSLSLQGAIAVLSNTSRVTYTSTLTLEDAAFDVKGGTYYQFKIVSSFVPQTALPILGYNQVEAQLSDQPQSMYTLIAFDQFQRPTTIKALSGSAIPYPFYNNPFVSTAYLDGTPSYNEGQGVLFPSTIGSQEWDFVSSISTAFAPPEGNDGTQSQYQLSMPLGTSVVNYKRALTPQEDSSFFQPWSTTLTPNNVVGNVKDFVLLQDTNFNIYSIDNFQPTRTFSNAIWTLTPDEIYPSYEQTFLGSIAANKDYYYFLGLNDNQMGQFNLRLKRYNPVSGVLYDYPLDGTFQVPVGGTIKGFTINDYEQIVLAYQDPTNTTRFYYNLNPSTTMTSIAIPSPSTATIAMDSATSTLYWIPLNNTTNEGTEIYKWFITDTLGFPGTGIQPTGTGIPPTWTGLAVNAASNLPAANDRLFLISQAAGFESNVYSSSLPSLNFEKVATTIPSPIGSISGAYKGGIWLTALQTPIIWGNRNTEPDLNGLVDSAWQIFYPFQKIILEKIANTYNPIVDTTYVNYPEYPHTAMFYYRNSNEYQADTSNRWGLESSNNFIVADTQMSGYYFNSYIFNVPLVKSDPNTLDDFQYLTVRGYSPTETSETLLRFNLPNLYDFGYTTQNQLIEEINILSSNPSVFNQTYATVLSTFNTSFIQSNSFFGQGYLPNFDGCNYDTSNFAGFASNVSTLYNSYQSNATLLSSINASVYIGVQEYISTNLKYILPASVQGRVNFTEPLLFKLLWKTGLLPQYQDLLEDWGLGYNLGYAKIDTPYSTYHRASSFYKILDDYIFLRLNPQYQLNRMDNTFKENFKITRDPTGQVQNFHGKLLLNNFNTYSQTFIYNNQTFNPPIGRLDHMYFEWVSIVGDTIDNNDCEWSASLAITESKSVATTASTIPSLPPMKPPRK